MLKIVSSLLLLLLVMQSEVPAGSSFDTIYAEYPKDRYLVGIGETVSTGKFLSDKRIAEVLARLEIAKQIKVRLKEETVDIMCEGGTARLFKDMLECRNEFVMVVEVTVDEFLAGSKIVSHWEQEGIVYAAAVMPKAEAVKELDNRANESADRTREHIEKAKKGDSGAAGDAQKEYMKAVTYDREKEMLDGVRSRASDLFDELERELVRLEGEP